MKTKSNILKIKLSISLSVYRILNEKNCFLKADLSIIKYGMMGHQADQLNINYK